MTPAAPLCTSSSGRLDLPPWTARPRRRLLPRVTLPVLGAAAAGAALVLQLSAPAAPPAAAAVGQPVLLDGLELTVTRVERGVRGEASDGTTTTAAGLGHGQERVEISVVVRDVGREPRRVEPHRFRLTTDGRPVAPLRPLTTTLGGAPLQPGTGMRGGLVLVVPAGTSPLELSYDGGPARIVLDDAVRLSASTAAEG